MPAVHCRRAIARPSDIGSLVSGIVERGRRQRGEGQRGEQHHGERQRREKVRLYRRWRDTASQLTKDGRIHSNVLFALRRW